MRVPSKHSVKISRAALKSTTLRGASLKPLSRKFAGLMVVVNGSVGWGLQFYPGLKIRILRAGYYKLYEIVKGNRRSAAACECDTYLLAYREFK